MNRRSFLSLLAGASAATATSYFFAPVGGWESDVIANPSSSLSMDEQLRLAALMRKYHEYWSRDRLARMTNAHISQMFRDGTLFE